MARGSGPVEVWGKNATLDELQMAAKDLIQQTDPVKVVPYLRLFRRRVFPLDPKLLFQFMEMQHPYLFIPAMTLSALTPISHQDVRQFALKLMQDSDHKARAIRLLANNYQVGDWEKIYASHRDLQTLEDQHDFAFSVQRVFSQNPDESAIPVLQYVYNHNPCSHCRRKVVEMMHTVGGLTQQIITECLYDSNFEIRDWVKSL